MVGWNPFGGHDDDGLFDEASTFNADNLPDAGVFLDGHDVLEGERHVAFHRLTREIFEERGVYDMTFGYNLARLNLDRRHPDAGYRYARETDRPATVRAEFTPTTPFCPQAHTLALGSFRAWNGERDRFDYELVRVRLDDMHHESQAINEELERIEADFRTTGEIESVPSKRMSTSNSDPSSSPF